MFSFLRSRRRSAARTQSQVSLEARVLPVISVLKTAVVGGKFNRHRSLQPAADVSLS